MLFGDTRRHGPFTLGEEYGSLDEMEPIDWQAVEADLEFARCTATGICQRLPVR